VPRSFIQYGRGILRYIRYSGVMMTCGGSRFPAVNTISSARLILTSKRDTTNATNAANISVRITAGTTTIRVFR
jgi:hypothetical protein